MSRLACISRLTGGPRGRLRSFQRCSLVALATLACSEDPTSVAVPTDTNPAAASSSIHHTTVSPESLYVAVGATTKASCQPRNRDGDALTNRNCNWTSRNEAVATVTGSGTRTGTITGRRVGTTWVIASATKKKDSIYVNVGGAPNQPPPEEPLPEEPQPPAGNSPLLLAAGDIASCTSSGDEATARLLDAHPDATVITLGDNVYDDGTTAEFRDCYAPSWGRHKARTRPSPGNHEYHTSGASGYYAYFGASAGEAGKGYYSWNLGNWHLISLNSNISMAVGSAQERWLRADLAANPAKCILAFWHHPRFSSAKHGNSSSTRPLWQALYEAGADIVLASHDHSYERFAPQNASGAADPKGIRSFVVGTGGRSHYGLDDRQPNSEVFNGSTFGVLKLDLGADSYSWEFLPVAGQSFTDKGIGACAGGDEGGTPPTEPTLASVHITPASVTVESGQTHQFRAYGRMTTGDSVGISVAWGATGGSISGGMYTAGANTGTYRVVGSASGMADTSTVTVTAAPSDPTPTEPATLASVHVTPGSATVETGGTQRFRVYGRTTAGDSVGVTAAWSATGGTIASGLYTAGASAGTYRVIASASGKADTSAVTVTTTTAPTPPPPTESPSTAARTCPASGYTRLVQVSGSSQLASALNAAQPGDQIRIAAGTYSSRIDWDESGTASSRIVVCAATPGSVLLTNMWVIGGSYVTVLGLTWQGPVGDENLVRIVGSQYVTFSGNEIRGGGGNAGLITQDVHHLTITYNYIHHNGVDVQTDHGIYFQRTTGVGSVIANNLLVENAARGISIHDNSGTNATDILVAHNTIVGNGSTGLLVNDGDRVIVANNIAAFNGEDRGQRQIRVLHGNTNQVRNNLTWSPSSSLAGIENTTSSPMSGNVVANPMLAAQFSDLRLRTGSPAIGLGLSQYSMGPDYAGQSRGSPPDAGAYEN